MGHIEADDVFRQLRVQSVFFCDLLCTAAFLKLPNRNLDLCGYIVRIDLRRRRGMGNVDPADLDRAAFNFRDCKCDRLVKATRPTAARVDNHRFSLFQLGILMAVSDGNEVIASHILRQILLFMGHIDVKPTQFKIQKRRETLRPLLIRITSYGMGWRDLLKSVKNTLTVDVSRMEDGVHIRQRRQHLRAEKIMGVRDDTKLHRLLPFTYFSV